MATKYNLKFTENFCHQPNIQPWRDILLHILIFIDLHPSEYDNVSPVRSTCPKETILRPGWLPTCQEFVAFRPYLKFVDNLLDINFFLRCHLMQQVIGEARPYCNFSDLCKPGWTRINGKLESRHEGLMKWATSQIWGSLTLSQGCPCERKVWPRSRGLPGSLCLSTT